jgi:hypothetical protein
MPVLLRKSVVIGDVRLPRPKIVQTVIMRGSTADCRAKLEELCCLPENQSTADIEVVLELQKDRKQINYTSKTITKGNGQRNPDSVAGDASESDY